MLGSAVDTWATVGVAIGTLATVVYALFRDVVVVPRRRPRLELHLDDRGDGHARLRVANRPGKDSADDVVLIGLPLMWSGTSPALTVASVHPGSQRHVDLVHDEGGRTQPSACDPGTYEVSVEVRARNADAIRYVIPLATEGTSLRVESPRKTP
jgi:hypothetical protein